MLTIIGGAVELAYGGFWYAKADRADLWLKEKKTIDVPVPERDRRPT